MFYVYVIKSDSGKHYTGHTNNIQRRLSEHNNGMCKTTKPESNWEIVHLEKFDTRGKAMIREKWLKTGKGRAFIKSIITD
ncbi:MAG: GIY-YIG nuclease family protein [candidate division Zixibacteria bacterium]|nr:GIY-YIG nuclease family protein [candidate division Zixibacteria bacterium]